MSNIQVKYLKPTKTKSARLIAKYGKMSITCPWNEKLTAAENYLNTAQMLINETSLDYRYKILATTNYYLIEK